MGRVFTFGCSFTEYRWPTWADIILCGNEGYNCAVTGGGFDSILYRLMEVNRKFKLTNEDKVIIVFTTPLRWDLITNLSWSTHGQVTNNKSFDKYENILYSIDGLVYKSYNNILLIHEFLKNKNLNYIFGSITDIYEHVGNYFEFFDMANETKDLISYVKGKVEIKLCDFKSFMGENKSWEVTKKYKDDNSEYHPRPKTHYKWVTDVLMKHIDIDLKVSENQIKEIENHIDKLEYVEDSNKIKHVFPEFFDKRVSNSIYITQSKIIKSI